jgi:hypothetical protein
LAYFDVNALPHALPPHLDYNDRRHQLERCG